MKKSDLHAEYKRLSDDTNFPNREDKTRRGKEFERLLTRLLDLERLFPKSNPFRPKGEELDGSFVFGNRVYLLEAKWHANPLPASTIYQFKGKVDGKLVGTLGIFISISGFSKDSIDALTYGKSLNIILFDGNDFEKCFQKEQGFSVVLEQKLRAAAELGLPFFSVSPVTVKSQVTKRNSKSIENIVIVVEGQGDQEIVAFLAQKILNDNNVKRKLMIRNAGCKLSMARLANAIKDFSDDEENKYILIADGDSDTEGTLQMFTKYLDADLNACIIIPESEIEIWFQEFKIYDRNDLMAYANNHKTKPGVLRQNLLNKLNVNSLVDSDTAFRKFYNALLE